MGTMKVAMKRYLKTASLLVFTALLTLSISVCVAHCAPPANEQAAHDCCHPQDPSNNTQPSHSCSFCSITTASNLDSDSLFVATGSVALKIHHFDPFCMSLGASLPSINHIFPQQKILTQVIYNEGSLSKDYQRLVSHIYFELT